jgi:putative DNA primase/helicase
MKRISPMPKFPDKTFTQDDINKNIAQFPGMQPAPQISVKSANLIIPKEIEWLWNDRIAFGKITLFAGEPGVGKSQLLLYIASVLSNAQKFHFENKICKEGKILIIAGEDNADDTVVPRLKALNANLPNIHLMEGIKKIDSGGHEYFDSICLIEHLIQLEEKIKEHQYKLLIIDPISLYLGSVDENKNKEIRNALNILNGLAQRNNLAIILNSHFSKPSGSSPKNAIYRVMGSIGFAAAARMVFGIMKDPEDPQRRLFLPIKNNLGQDEEGFVYCIKSVLLENGIKTSRIDWINEKITQTADEIMNTLSLKATPVLDDAKQFLLTLLKEKSVPLSEIRAKFLENGFSINRLYKAKAELNINEEMSIDRKRGKIWMLPPS